MDAQSLVIFLVIGLIAGWLAGQLVRGGGFGLVGDLIVGVLGALIAGWLFPSFITIGDPLVRQIVSALLGAILLLLVLRVVRRA